MNKLSLMEVLEGIEDTQRKLSVWYPLHEVLFIMLTAVICGATSYAKVEIFGERKEKWLKKYIKLENGVPDACTFRNVIRAIDTQQLHTAWCWDSWHARKKAMRLAGVGTPYSRILFTVSYMALSSRALNG